MAICTARGNKPATVSNRYRALHRSFEWLRDEGERTDNPLARIKPPRIPEQVLPHYEPQEVEALVRVCGVASGNGGFVIAGEGFQ